MATISENLQTIVDSTSAIKQAIINKGGTIEGDISTWANAINALQTGGSTSNEEITFIGTLTWDLTNCTITGNLSSKPEGVVYGASLVMTFRNSIGVVMGSTNIMNIEDVITITCDYEEPVMSDAIIIPALYIIYESNLESKIVPVKFESV